jgi:transposase
MFFDELSNDEWALVAALVADTEVREHRRGRPRAHPRTIVNAVLWILTTGETWSKLPSHFPTVPTCRRRFAEWQANGTLIELVKRLGMRGRSFAYVPSAPAEPAPRVQAATQYECDRLRGVFWQNPESWLTPGAEPLEVFAAAPRRLADARDVAQANAPAPLAASHLPLGQPAPVPSYREVQPFAGRVAREEEGPMPFDPNCSPVQDGRGYSIYAIARPVSDGMFRGWAEVIKEGRRVERSGLIGPRYANADEARAYALEWSHRWIAAQSTRTSHAHLPEVASAPVPAQRTAVVVPRRVVSADRVYGERAESPYADVQS